MQRSIFSPPGPRLGFPPPRLSPSARPPPIHRLPTSLPPPASPPLYLRPAASHSPPPHISPSARLPASRWPSSCPPPPPRLHALRPPPSLPVAASVPPGGRLRTLRLVDSSAPSASRWLPPRLPVVASASSAHLPVDTSPPLVDLTLVRRADEKGTLCLDGSAPGYLCSMSFRVVAGAGI
ncbi:hypothetical protein GUJ93_ZPchr0012g22215 [Zizania palustris]|uniref:Uncharacterized protein n=1 Tax=Zizania palustris TaxID=103762 RepID=A0A8J6BSV3_ZIZPA|nr:hypothetical protein GUJ93_ZPchr0012g22215 [Zizania palustris]